MMDYLLTLHGELFSCPKKRDLQNRIIMLGKGFTAREWTRKAAWTQNQHIKRTEMGYLCRKMCLHERRMAEDQSALLEFEKLAEQQKDDDTYDTDADNESERLEGAIEKEKSS